MSSVVSPNLFLDSKMKGYWSTNFLNLSWLPIISSAPYWAIMWNRLFPYYEFYTSLNLQYQLTLSFYPYSLSYKWHHFLPLLLQSTFLLSLSYQHEQWILKMVVLTIKSLNKVCFFTSVNTICSRSLVASIASYSLIVLAFSIAYCSFNTSLGLSFYIFLFNL